MHFVQPKERIKVKLVVVKVDQNAIRVEMCSKSISKLEFVLLWRIDGGKVEVDRLSVQGTAHTAPRHFRTEALQTTLRVEWVQMEVARLALITPTAFLVEPTFAPIHCSNRVLFPCVDTIVRLKWSYRI